MEHALVLFSGGLDSTTLIMKPIEAGYERITLLSVDYGSRHAHAELPAAKRVFEWYHEIYSHVQWTYLQYNIPRILFAGGSSSLMEDVEVPDGRYLDPGTEGPTNTEVPFRNANLLSIATTYAMKYKAKTVYAGMHASDHEKWAYPDCSPEFLGAMSNAIYVGTMHRVRLVTPFVWMTKAEIACYGANLGAPLEKTWSCYRGGDFHCGTCPTCLERHEAMSAAYGVDPTKYMVQDG